MLWVRAKGAGTVLSDALIQAGAILDEAIAYQTVTESDDPTGAVKRFLEEGADIITFTSASTVQGFVDMGLKIPSSLQIASIGPVTSQAIRDLGLKLTIEAKSHDIPGLVEAVLELGQK
jgi:uroporphyrinogen III methyltransferase / synthase